MCSSCLAAEVSKLPHTARAAKAIRDCYVLGAGDAGPLHIVVEDTNVSDEHLAMTRGIIADPQYTEAVRQAAREAVAALEACSPVERAAVTLLDYEDDEWWDR